MRGIRMGKRSVYRGISCLHCHKPVTDGRAALASTYYVLPTPHTKSGASVMTYSRRRYLAASNPLRQEFPDEMEVRIVYHRACIEKILEHAPVDDWVAQSRFEAYRQQLMERYHGFHNGESCELDPCEVCDQANVDSHPELNDLDEIVGLE